jgi:ATP-binding cassette subfamily B (MDR/TAP) protein 7
MNALRRAAQNRTSICIAHRLSTVVDADQIFVLKDGQALESGDHMSLVTNPNSFYAQLWQKQHQLDRELFAKKLEIPQFDDKSI